MTNRGLFFLDIHGAGGTCTRMAKTIHIKEAGELTLNYPSEMPAWLLTKIVPQPLVGPNGEKYSFRGIVVVRRFKAVRERWATVALSHTPDIPANFKPAILK